MKLKILFFLLCSAALLIALKTVPNPPRGSHEVDPKIKKEVLTVLDNFMSSFNARNATAHYATYHFPHYRLASGKMTVLESFPTADTAKFLQKLVQAGWHHTKWDHRNVVQASAEKVHVDTRFTRYRSDGTVLGTYESLYVLTFENNRWAIKLRSSFAE